MGNFFSTENFGLIWKSLNWIIGNLFYLAVSDSLIPQLIAWGIALYLLGYLPLRIKRRPQFFASLSLLIVIPFYYFIGTPYMAEFAGGIVLTIVILGILEQFGVNISRESEIRKSTRHFLA